MQPSEKSAIIPGMKDLVLANGRVMAPATGLDAVRIAGAIKPVVK